ncbi:lysophospholipase L1-like esterase [Mucilaginibacter sp. UYP25]|uniref:SGNH/GDSL hydrolase family protein n=1 Tax=unclassified Mucilaginibacter TaxID=2617802 RepID=UPI00339A2053
MKKLFTLIILIIITTSFAPQKQLTWTAIGDSITYMNGRPELSKNRISRGYMDDVVDKLPYVKYVNNGHSGWTAKGIADNINNLGLVKSDVYSVFLGTNDWWTGLPIGTLSDYQNNTGSKTAYGSYRIIIDKIRSLNDKGMIILMTPLHRTDYVDLNSPAVFLHGDYKDKDGVYLSQYADAVKVIATAEHLKLADLYYKSGITTENAVKYRRLRDPKTKEYKNYNYPEYTTIPYNPATDDYPYPVEAMNMTYDGLHPSDQGHRIIADMLIRIMKYY